MSDIQPPPSLSELAQRVDSIHSTRPKKIEPPARIEPSREQSAKAKLRIVWISLATIGLVALGALIAVWVVVNPAKETLWYEVAKSSLQVLSVVAIGGIVTAAVSELQYERQKREADLLNSRQRHEAALQHDRQVLESGLQYQQQTVEADLLDARQKFVSQLEYARQEEAAHAARLIQIERLRLEVRTALFDRASRCAQKMFVTSQHVRRTQSDNPADPSIRESAGKLLDQAYLEFSTDAEALEAVFAARYGFLFTLPKDSEPGEPHLRWHQISDLLTVYYFNLKGNFRKDVLARNSFNDEGRFHSGLDFTAMIQNSTQPTSDELRRMRHVIRVEFRKSLEALGDAIMKETPHLGEARAPQGQ